ncbi:MAG: sugar transferase, partial [Erysipelotrichaceae bacterium]|nr:sugar transferase [Erysipelotrichaceae bacterium]
MTKSQQFYVRCIKRPISFIGALIALLILSPLFLATMILLFFANKNGFKGIFFTQDRPGKNEKIFKALKFKTMTDERDTEGNLLPDADRLTRIGKFIRSTSIDELPQLINILKGDMAFIGPRPLLVQYL